MNKYEQLQEFVGTKRLNRWFNLVKKDNGDLFCGFEREHSPDFGIIVHPDNSFTVLTLDVYKATDAIFFYRCSPYACIVENRIDGEYINGVLWNNVPLTFDKHGDCLTPVKQSAHTKEKRNKFNRYLRWYNRQLTAITRLLGKSPKDYVNRPLTNSAIIDLCKDDKGIKRVERIYFYPPTEEAFSLMMKDYPDRFSLMRYVQLGNEFKNTQELNTKVIQSFRRRFNSAAYKLWLDNEFDLPTEFEDFDRKKK